MSGDALEPQNYYVAGDEPEEKTIKKSNKKEKTSQQPALSENGKKAKKEKKPKKSIFEDANLSALPPAHCQEIYRKHLQRSFSNATEIELDDMALAADAFTSGSDTNSDQSKFESFFLKTVPEWKEYLKDNSINQPRILIISAAAIRCVELLKNLPNIRTKCTIAKLFAKHFKVQEQVGFLSSHKASIAIGTPARLLKLSQEPRTDTTGMCIDLQLIDHVIIDGWRDGKDRTVFDVPEIRKELFELLSKTLLRERLNSGKCKISFF